MKPFNLVEALTGKPVCDRNGNEVKNFRVRTVNDKHCAGNFEDYPFVADVDDFPFAYTSDGMYHAIQSDRDLFMADEQTEDNQEIELLKERVRKLEDQLKAKEVDPYKELKDAVTQGKEVQFKSCTNREWMSLGDLNVSYWSWASPADRYRIKPEVMRYRVYEWEVASTNTVGFGLVQSADQESSVSKSPSFVRWTTDWTEVEV